MTNTVRRKKWNDIELMGQRIREARERLGMTQEALAEHIGRTRETVSRYEMGTRAVVVTELPTLADALKVPMTYLFGYTEPTSEALTLLLSEMASMPLAKQKVVLDRIRLELEWWKSHVPNFEEPSPDNIPVA